MEIYAPDKKVMRKDLLILAHLRNNARETLTNLSKKTSIPISTIYDRLKETSIIKKHTCLIDYPLLGYNTRAQIVIKIGKKNKHIIQDTLMAMENVNSVYKINNGYDYMLDVIFRNIKELENFLEELEEGFTIKAKQVYYVIDNIKSETFMSKPELIKVAS